jgi:hypothetical protein
MNVLTGGLARAALALAAIASPAGTWPADANFSPVDILAKSRARYAALKTYADTGKITTEYRQGSGPALVESHAFRTAYAAPRRFLFDFRKGNGERLAVWGDGEQFHSWWSATGVHEAYPRGQGANAFALSSLPTVDTVVMIPPLLFAGAGLHGAAADFESTGPGSIEKVGTHDCYKLPGRLAVAYGTGNVRGARRMTLWIDTQLLLVIRIFEDTPDGMGSSTVTRASTTFEPQADPILAPNALAFSVPK